jgi:hypothetical protein
VVPAPANATPRTGDVEDHALVTVEDGGYLEVTAERFDMGSPRDLERRR